MNESHQDAADALTRTMKTLHDYTKKVGDQAYEAFTAHPRAKRMTYCEHFRGAAWTALRMVGGAAALAVHAVFPFLLQTTGSDTVRALHREQGLKEDDVVEQLVEGHQEGPAEEQEESEEEPAEEQEEQEEPSQEQEEELDAQAHVGLLEPLEESSQESAEESDGCEACDAREEPAGLDMPAEKEELQEELAELQEEPAQEPEGHQEESAESN